MLTSLPRPKFHLLTYKTYIPCGTASKTGPGAHSAPYTMGTGFLSRGKPAGRWR